MTFAAGSAFSAGGARLLPASAEHAAGIAALHRLLFDPAWDEAAVGRLLAHPASVAFVAERGRPSETVGFVMAQRAADEAEILSIGVAPQWQRQGIGCRLIEELARAAQMAGAERIFLEVAADNAAALALYQSLTFTEVSRRRAYYARTDATAADALVLSLALGRGRAATALL